MARQVIHYMKVPKARSRADLKGRHHLHYCKDRDCRKAYTDSCTNIDVNGRCHDCRGTSRPVWVSARDPQPCCIQNCEMVSDLKIILRYTLAGPGPWFQCRTCARAHGWPCA